MTHYAHDAPAPLPLSFPSSFPSSCLFSILSTERSPTLEGPPTVARKGHTHASITCKTLKLAPNPHTTRDGGTTITLAGAGFRDLGGIFCRFGNAPPVRALVASGLAPTEKFTCKTPAANAAHSKPARASSGIINVPLSITINDDLFGEPSALNFTYFLM